MSVPWDLHFIVVACSCRIYKIYPGFCLQEKTPNDSLESENNVSTNSENGEVVEIHFSKKEFDDILQEKAYRQNEKNKYSKTRMYKIFTPGKWQTAMTNKLWDECRISCGFLYERGRIYENAATIKGKLFDCLS